MTSSYVQLQRHFNDSLEKSFQLNNLSILQQTYDKFHLNETDKKCALDQSFRDILLKSIVGDVKKTKLFLSFSIAACRADLVTSAIPVVLLSDLFEVIDLEKCELLFTFVEDNVTTWKESWFFGACKNNLLRMCNDLLRRLSRSQNTVFCGRILLFLAKFFPFSERSGLNIVSEFNLENLTEFDNDSYDLGDALLVENETVPMKIDYNLYNKFWALQDFFRNPNQCYNKNEWRTFSSHCQAVLSAFSSFKLEEHRTFSNQDKNLVEQPQLELGEAIKNHNYFAKFLTNPKLLILQLSDSNFRRSVLVQCLILFQYLRSTVKFKAESFSLTSTQLEFIKDTNVQIYKLIEETPPNGAIFAKTVEHMLQREELWNNWKNEGCKEFKRPMEPFINEETNEIPHKKRRTDLGTSISESINQNKFYMSNTELTRLWNVCPDNLQACRGADRNFLPSIELYLENPKDKVDPSFEWRALRLLARQSQHFFTLIQSPNKVSDYLEGVRKKIQECKTKNSRLVTETVASNNAQKPDVENVLEKDECMVSDMQEETEEMLKTQFLTEEKNNFVKFEITPKQLDELSVILASSWRKLGIKLGFSSDELQYFFDTHSSSSKQARAFLQIWFEDDVDASLENLCYTVEGLDMISQAEQIKRLCPSYKMNDVSA